MWPQKWKASASPGRTARATSPPAVSAVIAPPIRARKPRREVPAASPSSALPAESPAGSGNERLRDPPFAPAVLRGGEDALELREVVERALREHGAVEIERDRERAPGNAELAPRRRVGVLLERPHGEFGIACEHGDDGSSAAQTRHPLETNTANASSTPGGASTAPTTAVREPSGGPSSGISSAPAGPTRNRRIPTSRASPRTATPRVRQARSATARPRRSHWSVETSSSGRKGSEVKAKASKALRATPRQPTVERAPKHAHGAPERPRRI